MWIQLKSSFDLIRGEPQSQGEGIIYWPRWLRLANGISLKKGGSWDHPQPTFPALEDLGRTPTASAPVYREQKSRMGRTGLEEKRSR